VPHALGVDVREGQLEPDTVTPLNENLLRAAEIAENDSFVVTEKLKEIVSMLRSNNLNDIKSKVNNTIDSISNIVDELDKFHGN